MDFLNTFFCSCYTFSFSLTLTDSMLSALPITGISRWSNIFSVISYQQQITSKLDLIIYLPDYYSFVFNYLLLFDCVGKLLAN